MQLSVPVFVQAREIELQAPTLNHWIWGTRVPHVWTKPCIDLLIYQSIYWSIYLYLSHSIQYHMEEVFSVVGSPSSMGLALCGFPGVYLLTQGSSAAAPWVVLHQSRVHCFIKSRLTSPYCCLALCQNGETHWERGDDFDSPMSLVSFPPPFSKNRRCARHSFSFQVVLGLGPRPLQAWDTSPEGWTSEGNRRLPVASCQSGCSIPARMWRAYPLWRKCGMGPQRHLFATWTRLLHVHPVMLVVFERSFL